MAVPPAGGEMQQNCRRAVAIGGFRLAPLGHHPAGRPRRRSHEVIRMKRSSLGVVVALAVTLLPAVVHAQPKVSGTIVAVASDGQSFALEELGVEGKPVRRTVALGAGAGLLEVS